MTKPRYAPPTRQPGTPEPSCYGCRGTGTLQWAGIHEIRCSCVEHTDDCEPGMCATNCPSRGEAEEGFPQRCSCCDDRIFHFARLGRETAPELLARWLASPYRIEGVAIDCDDTPIVFDTARDAEQWLDGYERVATVGRAIDAALEARTGRSL